MNVGEHLLVTLGEEGCEVAKEASKALRFGLGDIDPTQPDGPNNREKLTKELNDLLGVCQLLVNIGVLKPNWQSEEAQFQKMVKVEKFMKYAEQNGTLDPDDGMDTSQGTGKE